MELPHLRKASPASPDQTTPSICFLRSSPSSLMAWAAPLRVRATEETRCWSAFSTMAWSFSCGMA
ncbi:hypothetical protein B7P34_16735 [Streptosporangium nondiastaticum]|uniref:Uncharacterized protein n=1 Tax=Streptosporangium nondiastaticum TaxID=35764 RepID=A0A9X7JPS2_9ACTN|nr:hypothetical protein B7P34_16735 [Streptosporangium nondiastaticum]